MLLITNNADFYVIDSGELALGSVLYLVKRNEKSEYKMVLDIAELITEEKAVQLLGEGMPLNITSNAIIPLEGKDVMGVQH